MLVDRILTADDKLLIAKDESIMVPVGGLNGNFDVPRG